MRFIATVSFSTSGRFDAEKDDPAVNALLGSLQSAGAVIRDIKVKLAGRENGTTALYVIEYEADSPMEVRR